MLFLGTKKFPKEGELENFLTSNAGQSNAFTGDEETCYFFTVNQNALKGALNVYSQFFVEPLFTESGVEREINAVNSENRKISTPTAGHLPSIQDAQQPEAPHSQVRHRQQRHTRAEPQGSGAQLA